MGNFNRDNRSGGGRDFGRPRRDFGGDRGPDREMFKTVCSRCGKSCEVPFKPTGSKPVYCSDCFKEVGGRDNRSSGGNFGRSNFNNRNDSQTRTTDHPQYKEQFEALNTKLDKILKMLDEAAPVVEKKKRVVKKAIEIAPVEPASDL